MTSPEIVARQLPSRLAVLGAADVLAGAALAARGTSPAVRAFGRQTAMWGAIDLAIAGVFARRDPAANPHRLRRILLVNAGLDVGYVAAGAHVAVRTPGLGGRVDPDEGRGHGAAVVVQGVLLLAFDLWHARAVR